MENTVKKPWYSCFDKVFDVAVYGAGYAGYAAATSLHRAGHSAILIDTRGDVLWESGRSFALECGSSTSGEWRDWHSIICNKGAGRDGMVDGACAEVIATHTILESEMAVLYYVMPIALEKENELITAVVLATKDGPKRIFANQWIDASETGLLMRLSAPDISTKNPEKLNLFAYFESNDWPEEAINFSHIIEDGKIEICLRPTLWSSERCLQIVTPGSMQQVSSIYLTVLEYVRKVAPELFKNAILTHCSIEPLAEYGYGEVKDNSGRPANLAIACPGLSLQPSTTIADRFELGLQAVKFLKECPVAIVKNVMAGKFPEIKPAQLIKADVVVAGVGTGGTLAALAAARQNCSVVCFDLQSFPGGIGTGGGIHVYYYGAPGGLQDELDQRVQSVHHLLGERSQVVGFHPEAKKIILAKMFKEEGISFLGESLIYEVAHDNGIIKSVMLATPLGPVKLEAKAWVDGTGDGDLAVFAGAKFELGRTTDGLPHAYSQSSGMVRDNSDGLRRMELVNYDAGWCDPADPEDMTRARLRGICQYSHPVFSSNNRPVYLAPSLGLRQSRQIKCDLMLELGDFVERRRFDDCIGFSAGHYDSHIADYEFESDEGLFWVWFTRCGFAKSACEISYRMLLPEGLKNLFIGSRAAGRTHDAQFPVRMQRDMQRIGEVCGIAAALVAGKGVDSRQISFDTLSERLSKSGATSVDKTSRSSEFRWEDDDVFAHVYGLPSGVVDVRKGLEDMEQGIASAKIWHVYRERKITQNRVEELLNSSSAAASWLAAGVMAMWGDERAESRLIKAVESFEDGFPAEDGIGVNGRGLRPESNHWYQFNWVVAISLLRICGTERCLDTLAFMSREKNLPFNIRTAIAITILRLAKRGYIRNTDNAMAILDNLLEGQMPGRYVSPQRRLAKIIRGWLLTRAGNKVSGEELNSGDKVTECGWSSNCEDHAWQLHLVVAAARQSIGLKPQQGIKIYFTDERAFVRNAFKRYLF